MTYKQLEEETNKWMAELEEQERNFLTQATQVNAWDRLVIENGEKVGGVYSLRPGLLSQCVHMFVCASVKFPPPRASFFAERCRCFNGSLFHQIVQLNSDLERVKLEQQKLDHELDFVHSQQRELGDLLTPLEAALEAMPAISYQQHADLEREHT